MMKLFMALSLLSACIVRAAPPSDVCVIEVASPKPIAVQHLQAALADVAGGKLESAHGVMCWHA